MVFLRRKNPSYWVVQNFSKGAVAEFLLSHVIKIPNTPWNMLVRHGGSQICKWIQYFWPPARPTCRSFEWHATSSCCINRAMSDDKWMHVLLLFFGCFVSSVRVRLHCCTVLVIWCNMILIDNIFYFCLRPQVVRIPVCWKEKASMLALNVSLAASLLWWC